ncbi:unnamed protein product [Moneuplotes crassus]|uniref:FYVE-type domain-containing protein n=1 Tax=Euplotes crassus TaxID=5936 RepID=A0AAD1UE16_EUPCR|nr:unnamed protein product [Moneuplotes crassus]
MEMIITEGKQIHRRNTKHVRKPSPLEERYLDTPTHAKNTNSLFTTQKFNNQISDFPARQRSTSGEINIQINESEEAKEPARHARVTSNQNQLSGFDIRSNINLNLSDPRNGTILTSNLSYMSMLSENNEISNLARGLANANIKVREKTFIFDNADKIFSQKDPLPPKMWQEGERCTLCSTKFKKLRSSQKVSQHSVNFKFKHENCQLCGEAFCKTCVTTKIIIKSKKENETKCVMCKICSAKVIMREGVLDNIRKIEIYDEEIERHLKQIPKIEKQVTETNQNWDRLKESRKNNKLYFKKENFKQKCKIDEINVLIEDQGISLKACSEVEDKITKENYHLEKDLQEINKEIEEYELMVTLVAIQ